MRSTFLENLREAMATWFSRLGCTKKRCVGDWENRWNYSLRCSSHSKYSRRPSWTVQGSRAQGSKLEERSHDAQSQRSSIASARCFVCGDRDSAGAGSLSNSATAHRGG